MRFQCVPSVLHLAHKALSQLAVLPVLFRFTLLLGIAICNDLLVAAAAGATAFSSFLLCFGDKSLCRAKSVVRQWNAVATKQAKHRGSNR